MRSVFLIGLFCLFVGAILVTTLSGALLVTFVLFIGIFLIISIVYCDTWLLFLLGARELRASDEMSLFEAASQEAYKLGVKMPRLYFYSGYLERAFILQNQSNLSLILDKSLIHKCTPLELRAISFELLLQVKSKMAAKRTKLMFLLGLVSWIFNLIISGLFVFASSKNFQRSSNWFLIFFLAPVRDLTFKLIIGEGYFKKLENFLSLYPLEKNNLDKVGLKLRKPSEVYSLPSKKILELASTNLGPHFQHIMMLEFLPHEWDFLFEKKWA